MALMDKDELLASGTLKSVTVAIPEWATAKNPNPEVRVREATAWDREEYEEGIYEAAKGSLERKNLRAKLIVKCVIDADGDRLYSGKDEENAAKTLGQKSTSIIGRLFTAIQDLSAMTPKSVQAIEGNSAAGQEEGSNSSSPATSE